MRQCDTPVKKLTPQAFLAGHEDLVIPQRPLVSEAQPQSGSLRFDVERVCGPLTTSQTESALCRGIECPVQQQPDGMSQHVRSLESALSSLRILLPGLQSLPASSRTAPETHQ